MNASKARRRFMRWQRYVKKYNGNTGCSRWVYHGGYVRAHWGAMTAQRAAPTGIRVPWILRHEVQHAIERRSDGKGWQATD